MVSVELKDKIRSVHITVGYKGPVLAEHVIGVGVASVLNTGGHGNAWWLFNTLLSAVDQPVLVLTCDNVVTLDLELLRKEYLRLGCRRVWWCLWNPVAGLDGDYISQQGDVVVGLSRTEPTSRYCLRRAGAQSQGDWISAVPHARTLLRCGML